MKKAYPNESMMASALGRSNVGQWMKSLQDIIALTQKGHDLKDALEAITQEWEPQEILDFKHWMDFYMQNSHNKYKFAQLFGNKSNLIENGSGSFFPNVDNLKASLPFKAPELQFASEQSSEEIEKAKNLEVRKKIEALLGRLQAAEKIALRPEIHTALRGLIGISVKDWLATLNKLKNEIAALPCRASSISLSEDILIKNANRLIAHGHPRAAALALIKIAQIEPLPNATDAVDPMAGSDSPEAPTEQEDPVQEFLKKLNGDELEADDESEVDESEVDDTAHLTVTAQEAAPPVAPVAAPPPALEVADPASPDTPMAPPEEVALEVTDAEVLDQPDLTSENQGEETSSTIDPIDEALGKVKISDIVARLEGIASLFKNRQVARQLSLIDLMMDKAGIAPFFPTLAEAMRSALESNQYCQSRIEEILAKLRGTMVTPMSQHIEQENEDVIKVKLQEEEEAEIGRKAKRKEQALAEEQAEQAAAGIAVGPENAPAELAGPAQVEKSPPVRPEAAPAAPATPPAPAV